MKLSPQNRHYPMKTPSSVGITLILITTLILALRLACPPGSGCRFLLTVVVLKRDVK